MSDTGRISYLCGPPGCGKSARLRERYVEAVRAGGADSVIWLAPDAQAAGAVRGRIVSDLGGLYDPRLFTFPALAHAVLNANHETVAQLEPCQRTLLAGQLAARPEMGFSPKLVSRPGFIGALCAFVDELKRAAVHQDEFAAAVRRQFPNDERATSLARFYSSYQALLQEKKLFDEPGLFWQAHDLLEQGRRQPFEEAKLILVDGFTDFTTTQLQVLGHLAAEAEETIITLPLAKDDREELWAAPTRLLGRLQTEVGQGDVEWLETCADRPQPLRHLMDNLFCLKAEAQADAADAVQVLAAPGVLAEVREVLREVKTLLLSGVAADEIGLVFRSLEPYRHALAEVARETGVPLAVAGSEPLAARPSVQVVLDLLQVTLGDYRQPDVVKLLKSNFIDAEALRQGLTVTGEDLEWVACEARLIGGRDQWIRQLDLYSRRLTDEHQLAEHGFASNADGDEIRSLRRIERDQRVLAECRELFERLVQRLEPLEREQTRTEHVRGLHSVLRDFGVTERLAHADALHQMAANVVAFRTLMETLASLAEADGLLDRPERIPFDDFAAEVVTLCGDTQYDQPLRPEGHVVALDVYGARQVRKPYLFLCGLVETNWPQVRGEKTFFDDRERYRLNQTGIALDLSADLQSQEAFLFGLACAAAEKRLYLSYPTVDSEGQPLVRSHYVDEALGVFSKGSATHRQRSLSEVLIEPEEAVCRRELLETALARADLRAWELYAAAAPAGASRWADHARACSAVEQQRASREPFEGHDGLLSHPVIRERLAERYGPEYAWSATALGGYGTCPFSFFAQRVLRLETIEPPTEEVESLDYGNIIHRILHAFFSHWQTGHPDEALTRNDLDTASAEMNRLVDETFSRWEREGLVTHRALWRLAREQARRDLSALLTHEATEVSQTGFVPRAFEARYETHLPAGPDGEPLLIKGKIDRVDVQPFVTPGLPQQFAVYDYKGNDGVSPQLIEAGCDFQMPFYVTAVTQQVLAGQDPPATCAWWAYYRYRQPVKLCRTVEVKAVRKNLPLHEYLQKASEMAQQHVRNVRDGQFAVDPRKCPSYCDFKDVCRYTPSRIEAKTCAEIAQTLSEDEQERMEHAQEVQP